MPRKNGKGDIDELIEEILVDSSGDDEGFWAFREAFAEEGEFPQDAFVAGHPLSVQEVDYDGNVHRGLVAVCRTESGEIHRIGLADVVFPESAGARRTLAAYRSWLGIPEPDPAGTLRKRPRRTKPRKKTSISMPRWI